MQAHGRVHIAWGGEVYKAMQNPTPESLRESLRSLRDPATGALLSKRAGNVIVQNEGYTSSRGEVAQ